MVNETKIVNGKTYEFMKALTLREMVTALRSHKFPQNTEVGVFDMTTGEGVSCDLYDDEGLEEVHKAQESYKVKRVFYVEEGTQC